MAGVSSKVTEKRVLDHKELQDSCQNLQEWLTNMGEELDRWADVSGADKQSAQKKLSKIKVGNIGHGSVADLLSSRLP